MQRSADISPSGLYRYRLTRRWGIGPGCVFVMLNPSTADAYDDDPTIRRCIGFAKREGCGSLTVVNLFAYRATSPFDLRMVDGPIGLENEDAIKDALDAAEGPIIAAWGTHGSYLSQDMAFLELSLAYDVMCFGKTKEGHPRHPLYLPADEPLVVGWPAEETTT